MRVSHFFVFHAAVRSYAVSSKAFSRPQPWRTGSHVRLAHGAFVRPHAFTVAILAQGTNRGDALCAALLLRRVGSNPRADTFSFCDFAARRNCENMNFEPYVAGKICVPWKKTRHLALKFVLTTYLTDPLRPAVVDRTGKV